MYKGLKVTIIYFFKWGFFKGLSYTTCNIQVLWIMVKGSNQNNKVEGLCHDSERRLSTFLLLPEKSDKKKMMVVAMNHGNDP